MAASVAIAGAVGYGAVNAAALDQAQIRWNDRGSFGILAMLNGGVIEVCNPAPLPVSFGGVRITALWDGRELGGLSAGGASLQPGSSAELAGRGEATGLAAGIISSYVGAGGPSGGRGAVETSGIDLGRVSVEATLEAPLLGVIPLEVTDRYSGAEFAEMMGGGGGGGGGRQYAC